MTSRLMGIVFTRVDERGEKFEVHATVTPEGFHQWGAPTPIWGDNVAVLEAIQDAMYEESEE